MDGGRTVNFAVDPERAPGDRGAKPHVFWTELGYNQCPNCPLKLSEHRYCPAALDIEEIVAAFANVISHHPAKVEVRTEERTCVKMTDAQSGLRSLLGLCLATGGCPILSRLKGPARLHMPFASVDETLFRMVGSYLIGQYIASREGVAPDWRLQGLTQLYGELTIVNTALLGRLKAAAEKDANVNAVIMLMNVALLVAFSLEEQLVELRPFAIDSHPGA